MGPNPRKKVGMLTNRSTRRNSGEGARTSTGAESRGVLFPRDMIIAIEDFTEAHFPVSEWPEMKVGQLLTGLFYAGLKNPEAPELVQEYMRNNAPNSKVNKAAQAIENLSDEDKAALIKRLGLA